MSAMLTVRWTPLGHNWKAICEVARTAGSLGARREIQALAQLYNLYCNLTRLSTRAHIAADIHKRHERYDRHEHHAAVCALL